MDQANRRQETVDHRVALKLTRRNGDQSEGPMADDIDPRLLNAKPMLEAAGEHTLGWRLLGYCHCSVQHLEAKRYFGCLVDAGEGDDAATVRLGHWKVEGNRHVDSEAAVGTTNRKPSLGCSRCRPCLGQYQTKQCPGTPTHLPAPRNWPPKWRGREERVRPLGGCDLAVILAVATVSRCERSCRYCLADDSAFRRDSTSRVASALASRRASA
jgi:hypothetical protein